MKIHGERHRMHVTKSDLSGSVFDDVNLSGCTYENVNMSGGTYHNISRLSGMTIDGIEVTELIACWNAHHEGKGAEKS